MTKIILVRHGRSEANIQSVFAGHTDAQLSRYGMEQAERVADYLTAHTHIDAIYASDLHRAYHTALPTAERLHLPIKTDTALREIYAGEWENLSFDELNARFPQDKLCWDKDLPRARCTGGESVAEVFSRAVTAVLRIARENEGKTVLIASHWTPVLSIITHAHGGSVEDLPKFTPIYNAALHFFRFEQGVLIPERINVSEHLVGLAPNDTTYA